MSFQFSVDEVFQVAVEIERNGEAFYSRAAEGIRDQKLKDELLYLASMEKDHEGIFTGIKTELTAAERETATVDPNNETKAYLKALADTRVFFRKEIDMTSPEEILKSAMLAEKDSIAFYLGMKDMISGAAGKARMDSIIREEMLHLKILGNRLMEVKGW